MKKYTVLLCVVISVLLLFIATLLYPGGTVLNKDSVGFDCFMLLVLAIEYFTKAEDLHHNKTDRVKTAPR